MNVALVIYYLIRSALESLYLFVKHWYFNTWIYGLSFLSWVYKKWGKVTYYVFGTALLLTYATWAILPVYLLVKAITGYANFV